MSRSGTIVQISISRGGVPKLPVAMAAISERGVAGDAHADARAHGRPEQALCLYSVERIAALRSEGHHVEPGSTGENITTEGLDWRYVVPGARLRLGDEIVIEITGWASPCWKNARWFRSGDFRRIDEGRYPGSGRAYARVLQGGTIREGDPISAIIETAAQRTARLQPRTFRWPRDFQHTQV
jgi:MOSC domain-containing protein YiiM